MWTRARAGNLRVGDVAPDFTLPKLDKSAHVTLSSIRNNKPVVLVFGSYT
jgi:peroxiredoxin